jgi:hypothetical protein
MPPVEEVLVKYTCDKCGGTFTSSWPDEACEAEYQANFGSNAEMTRGILCDDCYEEFWKWTEVNVPKLKRWRFLFPSTFITSRKVP